MTDKFRTVAESLNKTRPNVEDLCAAFAVFAEVKPDCRNERKILLEQLEQLPFTKNRQRLLVGTTGCCVVDAKGSICIVEGSGSQHVAMELLRYSAILQGATVYLSRLPCAVCFRTLVASGVRRVIVVDMSFVKEFYDFEYSPEPPFNLEEWIEICGGSSQNASKKLRERFTFEKLMIYAGKTNTALSKFSPSPDSLCWKVLLDIIKQSLGKFSYEMWTMVCASLASSRSEFYPHKDEIPTVPIGAVIIAKQEFQERFYVLGIGYNGHLPGMTVADLQNEESFHAEENVLRIASPLLTYFPGFQYFTFCTHLLCGSCARMLFGRGIRFVYSVLISDYHFVLRYCKARKLDDKLCKSAVNIVSNFKEVIRRASEVIKSGEKVTKKNLEGLLLCDLHLLDRSKMQECWLAIVECCTSPVRMYLLSTICRLEAEGACGLEAEDMKLVQLQKLLENQNTDAENWINAFASCEESLKRYLLNHSYSFSACMILAKMQVEAGDRDCYHLNMFVRTKMIVKGSKQHNWFFSFQEAVPFLVTGYKYFCDGCGSYLTQMTCCFQRNDAEHYCQSCFSLKKRLSMGLKKRITILLCWKAKSANSYHNGKHIPRLEIGLSQYLGCYIKATKNK